MRCSTSMYGCDVTIAIAFNKVT
uniref:Uncharacterized protein n=1 Tax=Anguilla anguilla TaxID=7936 RepID=A0A0E9RM84_ANGAN